MKYFMDLEYGRTKKPKNPANKNPQIPNEDAIEQLDTKVKRPRLGQSIASDLWGVTFMIEYIDSRGARSCRRVSIRDVRQRETDLTICCWCHERDAYRAFKFDRITNVIDLDGVVHNPMEFFAEELLIDFKIGPRFLSRQKLFDNLPLFYTIPLMAGLSRTDGYMHPLEIDVILQYIEDRNSILFGHFLSDEEQRAAASIIKRLHVDQEFFNEARDWLETQPTEAAILARYAVRLVNADEVLADSEVEYLHRMKD